MHCVTGGLIKRDPVGEPREESKTRRLLPAHRSLLSIQWYHWLPAAEDGVRAGANSAEVSLSHPLIGLVCVLVWVLFGFVFLGLVVVVVVFFVCLFSYLQDLSVVDS